MATEHATRQMKSTPANRTFLKSFTHYTERDHRGYGVGEGTPSVALIRACGESEIKTERFSYEVQMQIETCSRFWIRVLLFEGGELVLTRRFIIGQGGAKVAIDSAYELAKNYYTSREAALMETAQPALPVAV